MGAEDKNMYDADERKILNKYTPNANAIQPKDMFSIVSAFLSKLLNCGTNITIAKTKTIV